MTCFPTQYLMIWWLGDLRFYCSQNRSMIVLLHSGVGRLIVSNCLWLKTERQHSPHVTESNPWHERDKTWDERKVLMMSLLQSGSLWCHRGMESKNWPRSKYSTHANNIEWGNEPWAGWELEELDDQELKTSHMQNISHLLVLHWVLSLLQETRKSTATP